MQIAAQLKVIRDGFAEWSRRQGASIEIATDTVHLFALLQLKPGGFHCLTTFRSQLKRGPFEESGMVDNTYWVVVSFGKSMQLNKGDALIAGNAGGRPLADVLEEAREIIRGLNFADDTEVAPNFKSILPLDIPTDVVMDAYYIEFSIGTQLPAVKTS